MKKKKILFQSDFALAKTGFGRHAKALLSYLYRTGKYDIVQYSCGMNYSNPFFSKTPWKTIGSLPDSKQELQELEKDPHNARLASYGAYYIDKIVKEEKPDIYIAVQDIWGIDFAVDKPWFNKINSVLWTTLDSLPILPSAIAAAKKCPNFWVWSSFATKAMNKMGIDNVKTVHGAIDDSSFFKLPQDHRSKLRSNFGLSEDDFVIGFVFRNQLRKSVPNLLEGYKIWKQKDGVNKKSKLLLHTSFNEGWNIHKLADEYGIDKNEILTTYLCKNCRNYDVKPFTGQDLTCKFCSSEKAQGTTNVSFGVTEEQLNEVYNLMDVYVHPFTSGGQEIPIQEAKFVELITLVTNYSCGEEMCEEGAYSLPLEWTEYREQQTEFRKASTSPTSIAEQMDRVYKMSASERCEMGKKARQWVVENYSINSMGRMIESLLDSMPEVSYSFDISAQEKDPYCQIENIEDNREWLLSLYTNILKMDIKEDDDGLKYWMGEFSKGAKRGDIERYFRNEALKDNQKNKKVDFSEFLNKDDNKRLLIVLPESIGDIFLSTSLFESIRNRYPRPEWSFYFACKQEYFEILEGNPHIDKLLNYVPQMDSLVWLEGMGDNKGYFDVVYPIHFPTQRALSYIHNGVDKIDLELKCT